MAKIYVGNLPPKCTEDHVVEWFGEFGTVEWVHLVTAVDTGQSRGAGYVKMSSGAAEAIRALDGRRIGDSILDVHTALPLARSEASFPRTPKRARNSWAESRLAYFDPAKAPSAAL